MPGADIGWWAGFQRAALLITVGQAEDGSYVVSTLIATADQFVDSLAAVQEEILLDGEPTFLEGIEPEDVGGEPQATPGV